MGLDDPETAAAPESMFIARKFVQSTFGVFDGIEVSAHFEVGGGEI
jgi:hypothetical protein